MDVLQVNGFADVVDGLILGVEELAFAIAFVDGSEDPAVAVEIGELGVFELGVKFGRADFFKKFVIGPEAAGGGGFGIGLPGTVAFLIGGVVLFGGIHRGAVGFVIPPGVA